MALAAILDRKSAARNGQISEPASPAWKATTPNVPETPVTPGIKQSPKIPESRKTPKFSFKTGSKGKRLLPKIPKSKTPKRKKSASSTYKTSEKEELATELPFTDEGGTTHWKTPADIARQNTRKLRRQTRQSRAEERKEIGLQNTATKRALKKLAQAPGWKPFGTPTKRKLDGLDW